MLIAQMNWGRLKYSLYGFYLKRSAEWFEKVGGPQLVIWNIENNIKLDFKELFHRLEGLKDRGPSDYAHSWVKDF